MRTIVNMLRLPNLLIIAFTLLLIRYFLFIPVYASAGIIPAITDLQYRLMIVATMMIAAAGYISNDYFDVIADRVNKPGKQYIGTRISQSAALAYAFILSICSIAIATWLAVSMRSLIPLLILALALAVAWWYAIRLKKSLLWGNIAVSCMSAGTIVMVWLIEHTGSNLPGQAGNGISRIVIAISIFAFLLSLLREIVKDMEDVEGDRLLGCRSLPITIGITSTRKMLYALSAVTAGLLIYTQVELIHSSQVIAAAWLMMAVEIPLLYFVIALGKSNTRNQFHKLSTLLKWIMLGGILTLIAGHF
jgi:4-hydroxybenzoate polyprenyltransferase